RELVGVARQLAGEIGGRQLRRVDRDRLLHGGRPADRRRGDEERRDADEAEGTAVAFAAAGQRQADRRHVPMILARDGSVATPKCLGSRRLPARIRASPAPRPVDAAPPKLLEIPPRAFALFYPAR